MNQRETLKVIHFLSTLWFVFSTSCMLLLAMIKAGRSWWFIVFVSSYSTLLVIMLIGLYLFAIFRSKARSQKEEAEHPLTTTLWYIYFYDISPFIGTFAGGIVALEHGPSTELLLVTCAGSFWATFLVWIIIDPIVWMGERLLPSSYVNRQKRLAEVKVLREQADFAKKRTLSEVEANEKLEQDHWTNYLLPYAQKLSCLSVFDDAISDRSKGEVADMGVKAWQMGGLNCMQQLHSMAIELCRQKSQNMEIDDYISVMWDGIGSWRSSWFEGELG